MKAKQIIALVLVAVTVLACTACTTTDLNIHLDLTPESVAALLNNIANGGGNGSSSGNNTPAPTNPGVTPESTQPQATQPSGGETTTQPSGGETTTQPQTPQTGAPQGTAAILAYYNTAANNIKAKASSVTRNYEDYQHNADKLVLPGALQSFGEQLIGSFLKKNETPQTYEGADVKNFYLPGETYVSKLTEADIKSATCKDNGSEYEITIVTNSVKNPTYGQSISAGFEIIKTEDVMDAAGFIVKSFDTEYYDCKIQCKVDKATGNITWINFSTPIIMNVASKIAINATVGMTFIKDYTVKY